MACFKALLFTLLISSYAFAQPNSALIETIEPSGIVRLKNGDVIRLPHIYVPPHYNALFKKVSHSFHNEEVVFISSQQKDRHGYFISDAALKDGRSLQQDLIEKGVAIVYQTHDTPPDASLIMAETQARQNKIGIWSDVSWPIHSENINTLLALEDNFVLAKGNVKEVKQFKDRIYINFGEDWKTDMTASIHKRVKKRFSNFDYEQLTGKTVVIRGWIDGYNGPFIDIYYPNHIEITP